MNAVEKTATYTTNCLMRIGYRIEYGRVGSNYMTQHHQPLEEGFRTWIAEQTLEAVHYEIYDPVSNKAYEVGMIRLDYFADPNEEVVKPPIEELERLFTRLNTLPPGAQFRCVVTTAPNATKLPGWQPTQLKDLMGGGKEDVSVGSFGFGHAKGSFIYRLGNWDGKQV